MEIPKIKVGVVTGPDDVVQFWDWLRDRPRGYVCIDTETGSGTPDGDARRWYEPGAKVRMAQFGDTSQAWAIPMQGWEGLVKAAFDWLNKSRTLQVWHNGFTFDMQFLSFCHGIELDPTLTKDTFVYAGLTGYAEDSRQLKAIAENELGAWAVAGAEGLHAGMKTAGWNWNTVPMDWLPYPIYGAMDTIIDAFIYEKWIAEGRINPEVDRHHGLEIAAAWMTNKACMTGITVDGKYLSKAHAHWKAQAQTLSEQCQAQGWGEPTKNAKIREILAEANVLDDRYMTDTGLLSVDKRQLSQAAAKHPLAQLVLDHRWAAKVSNDYLGKLWAKIDYATAPGIVHPSIWTMEAKTGRMSASDPPVQQFPAADPTVRNAVIASAPDRTLISADFGQIEVRGWAALYNDQVMLDLINEADRTGEDYFVLVARQIFNDPTFQKNNPLRKPIKNASYAMQYGALLAKIAEMLGMPQADVEPVVRGLRETLPSYRDGGASMIEQLGNGMARTVLPDGHSFQVRTWGEIRKLPNYRVQGWAAIVLKQALLRCQAAGLGEYFRLPVHDELIFDVPKTIATEAAAEIKVCMDSVVDPATYGVSVTTEPTIAQRWGSLKD